MQSCCISRLERSLGGENQAVFSSKIFLSKKASCISAMLTIIAVVAVVRVAAAGVSVIVVRIRKQ